ncbi:hypothetical protein [Streptomyces brevispora]|uniref:Uncharacterized protein n=1 Tax=Streptomyces brevispora TaxID=887462 RepID=A0A561UYB8_9ACTN|nr:hypothetical protein [Streptomyces brevispora]TWG04344.1 hypothetical protein FHX80_112789 [Streptomyces brevispora]WSC14613.1 hypothetical protein OIE64_18410 [Streptomyces brevispora]
MPSRIFAVSAAAVGAAVFATTGITYAAHTESPQAAPPAKRAAPAAKKAAPPVKQAAPAAAPLGTGSAGGSEDEDRGHEDRGHENRGHGGGEEGRIHFNDRTYSAPTEGCIAAASGLGSTSFSIYNESEETVEVYRGFNCDSGSPVATVGPYGATHGVAPRTGQGSVFVDDGVVASFRVIGHHDAW